MIFKKLLPSAFKGSILFFLLSFTYDLEIFFLSSTFFIGHALKGFISVIADYIYLKPLKSFLIFSLQLLGVATCQYILDFLL